MKLRVVPTTMKEANAFVHTHHRHNKPVVGTKFAIAVADESDAVRGVAIVSHIMVDKEEVARFRAYWKWADEQERLQRVRDYEAKRDGKLAIQRLSNTKDKP